MMSQIPSLRSIRNCRYGITVTTLYCLAILAATGDTVAQRQAWNWYFGDHAGLTFRNGEPQPLSDGLLETQEGCSSISDEVTGDLLFYTNGVTVWTSAHQVMQNGTDLNGDVSTSQSALIVPWPNNADLYFILTAAPVTAVDAGERCLCLMYSIVDMSADNGRGAVIEKNTILSLEATEHVTATRNCETGGWWVVARRRTGSAFVSFRISENGISPVPVVSSVLSGSEIRDAGQMHISPDGSRLVITSPSGVSQLYQFRAASGEVVGGIDLFGSEPVGNTYGAAFTADSRAVFIAATKQRPVSGIDVTRFLLDDRSNQEILESRQSVGFLLGTTTFAPMQLAPDRKIYIGKPDTKFLASIENPLGDDVFLKDSAVSLTGDCYSGLPNFPGTFLRSSTSPAKDCRAPLAQISDRTICANACLRLGDESYGTVTVWEWIIPGAIPNRSTRRSPTVCFSEPGTYPVTLIVTNSFGIDTAFAEITVSPRPSIVVSESKIICQGDASLLNVSGASEYIWSPRDGLDDPTSSSPLASPLSTTTYTVIGTDVNGCSDTAAVTVQIVKLRAGPDATICMGGTANLSSSEAESYLWEPSDGLDDPTSRTPVASPMETTTYTVTMQRGDCLATDTLVVNVVETFAVQIEAPDTSCIGKRVSISVEGGGSQFVWSGTGVEESDSASTFVTIRGGQTVVAVVAISAECTATDTVTIIGRPGPTIEAMGDAALCPGESTPLSVSGSANTFVWSPSESLNIDTGQAVIATPTSTTTYTVVASDGTGCTSSSSVTVIVQNAPVVSAGQSKSICKGASVRLSATGSAASYSWSPTDGLDDPTKLAPIASPLTTTLYVLTAERDGCTVQDSTLVVVSTLDLQIEFAPEICEGEQTELRASGAAVYSWSPSTGLNDPTIQNPIASPDITTTYEVTATDAIGCTATKRITVKVLDTLRLVLEAGVISAEAGSQSVSIPVVVDVDPSLLPVQIDHFRAAIVHRADVFLPTRVERGRWATSLRDSSRITYLDLDNILLVTPRQKISAIVGDVLLGHVEQTRIDWEDVTWDGIVCPRTVTQSGQIFVTGCNLRSRGFTLFSSASIQVRPSTVANRVDVTIDGTEPGTFIIQLISTDGRLLHQTNLSRSISDGTELTASIDMSTIAGGLYHVAVLSPSGPHLSRIVWVP